MKKSLPILIAALFLFGYSGSNGGSNVEMTITLSASSGYSSETLIYKATGDEKEVAVIALHGKSVWPGAPNLEKMYKQINKSGYTIYALTMPWSEKKREGTFEQAMEIIDKAAVTSGKQKVVVLGHSMGGVAALRYGARGASVKVIGIIAVAPGHDPHMAKKLRDFTAGSVGKANKMVAEGKGKQRSIFKDLTSRGTSSFETTAEYYVSFYDPNSLPSLEKTVHKIELPVLLVAGKQDKLTKIYRMKKIFGLLPNNPKNLYLESDGSHYSVLGKSAVDIADWINQL